MRGKIILGTTRDDTLRGTAGNDVIWALGGNDIILAGAGDDLIFGDSGNDNIDGEDGDDAIYAYSGNDILRGGAGDDYLNGGSGNDTVDGGTGDDCIDGESGNDSIQGGAGNDHIDAGGGNDLVDGGTGHDDIDGEGGNDTIDGGSGNDEIRGGDGDDIIDGGAGSDSVRGGAGNDTVVWRPGASGDRDELSGEGGRDTLRLEFTAAQWASAALRQDVTNLTAFISAHTVNGAADSATFSFASQGLRVRGFETLVVLVDGVPPGTVTPPAAPTLTLDAGSDSGTAGDRITNDNTPTLTGTAAAGSTVRIRDGAALLGSVLADAQGRWTYTPASLGDGLHSLTATAANAAGESAASSALALTIDTAAPVRPAVDLIAADDAGGSATDNLTNRTSVRIDVAAETGSSVRLGSQTVVAANGVASFNVAIVEGANVLTAVATDAAGNASLAGTLTVTRDTAGPAAPTLLLAAASDSGIAGDRITSVSRPVLNGVAEAGALVTVREGNAVLATATADANGAWSVTLPTALADGTHALAATATDAAGNAGAASAALVLTIDTAAPNAPVLDLVAADDSGASDTDNLTNTTNVRIDIAAETGSTVRLGNQSAVSVGGTARFTVALAEGPNALSATATDAAGNVSSAGTLVVTRDTAAPDTPVIDLIAGDDTGTSSADNLTNRAAAHVDVTAEAGSMVRLGSQSAVAAGGVASFDVALAEGVNTLSATVTDGAGNVSAAGTLIVTRDTLAPNAPVLDLRTADDSGSIATDDLTNVANVRLDVAAETGSTVRLGSQSAVAVGGAAQFTVALAEGANTLSATATDAAGNVSSAGTLVVTRDTAAPGAPVIDLIAADDSGASGSDDLTNRTTVHVDVAAEAGSTVRLGGQTAVATGGTAGFDVALAEGANTLSATATDAAGNVSSAGTLVVMRDTLAPGAPTIALDAASDSGVQGDGRTTDTTPTITGVAEAGARVVIANGATDVATVTADAAGRWAFTFSALATGNYSLTARATDSAGNEGSASPAFTLGIDPVVQTGNLTMAVALSDRYQAQTDTTGAATVTLVGTGNAGETVRLFDAGGTEIAHTIVDTRGTYRFADVHLAVGENDFSVRSFAGTAQTGTLAFDAHRVDDLTTGNAVLGWIQTATQVFAAEATTPTAASRALAMTGQAMLNVVNAVNGVAGYQFSTAAPTGASLDAAIAQAAHDVLKSIFPGSSSLLDARLASALAAIPDGPTETDGIALGQAVAARIIALRADDGWDTPVTDTGADAVGRWQPTPLHNAPGLDPQWANLDPFVMRAADQFDPGAPPAIGSPEWIAAFNQTRDLGAADSTLRTADETQSVRFWAQGVGTSTPAGLWAQIAMEAANRGDLSVSNAALLFARLGLAQGDAGISAWNTKYEYDAWRPITAIRDAAAIGDPAVVGDRDWTPYIITPPFPEYTSGHSTFSAASAAVLTQTFGANYAFTTTSGGLTRSFASFDAAAEAAGMSRILGGIHFAFSDAAGQASGTGIGQLVNATFNGMDDLFAPRITFDIATGIVTTGGLVIAGAASDDLSGVARLFWSLDGGGFTPLTQSATGDFSLAVSAFGGGLAAGLHRVTISAVDAVGHAASATIDFVLDGGANDIVLSSASVQNGQVLDAPALLAGNVVIAEGNALTALGYSIDGGAVTPIAFASNGSFSTPLDLSRIALGAHQIDLVARDTRGQVTHEIVNLNVASQPFTVTELTPDRNEAAVGVTYRPSVHFSRPVDVSTLTSASFYVTDASGARVAATIVPFADRTGAWLLPQGAMPGGQTLTVHIDGDAIRSIDGTILDANGAAAGRDLARQFTTVSSQGVPGTTITGIVLDPGADFEPGTRDDVRGGLNGLNIFANNTYLNPLAGVRVYILGHEDLGVLTDAQGRFTIENAPAGHIQLAIDGRTATNAPAGFFFPEMVMDVEIQPGIVNTPMSTMGSRETQVANAGNPAVYLPRVDSNIFAPVAATGTTVVHGTSVGGSSLTLEQAGQVTLTVSGGGNSFIGADGQPVASPTIGVAPVPPALVMDMLPAGVLQHTFDITIQAPGVSVFTQEIVLTMPNVFGLPPGAVTNVLSFDHTTGRLEINGTATVSADGLTITTDPGSGIRAPGWHGITDLLSPGHLDLSVRCDPNDPTRQITLDDVEKAINEGTSLLSAFAGSTIQGTPLEDSNTIAGVQQDSDAIGRTMTEISNAYYAGDTGGYGPPDASYYFLMGSKLLGDIAKTGLDVGAAIIHKVLPDTPVDQTTSFLANLTSAASAYGNWILYNESPIDNILNLGSKLLDKVMHLGQSPNWTPPATLETPPAVQALNQAVQTARAHDAQRAPLIQSAVGSLQTITQFLTDNFDGTRIRSVADLLDDASALRSAANTLASAAEAIDNIPSVLEDIDAINEALLAVLEAFEHDTGIPVPDLVAQNGTDGDAGGANDVPTDVIVDNPVTYGPVAYYLLENLRTGTQLRGSFNPAQGIDLFLERDTDYKLTVTDPLTGTVGITFFRSGANGQRTDIPNPLMLPDTSVPEPNGLTHAQNQVLGINGNVRDGLVEGVPDNIAVVDGLLNAPALANVQGVLGSVALRGEPTAVVVEATGSNAGNLTAYVATGTFGLAVVDVTVASAPTVRAQLDLPGVATDLVYDRATQTVIVATGAGGLYVVDVSDPTRPAIIDRIQQAAGQIELLDGIVYVANGAAIVSIDAASGQAVETLTQGTSPIVSLVREGTMLHALTANGTIESFSVANGDISFVGAATFSQFAGHDEITVGNGIIYVSYGDPGNSGGFAAVDVRNPAAPVLLHDRNPGFALATEALALDGSGRAIGAQYLAFQFGQQPRNFLEVIDVSDPAADGTLLNRYTVSGQPVDVAIGRGLAFVLTTRGLDTVRYAEVDRGTGAPSITVDAPVDQDSATAGIQRREGELISFAPQVTDDVGVRQVELTINGRVVATDVSFPFGLSALLPTIAENGGSPVVQIGFRATDTGGNVTVHPGFTVNLTVDQRPLTIVSTSPLDEGFLALSNGSIVVKFSKPIDAATASAANFAVVDANGNVVVPDSITLRDSGATVQLNFGQLAVGAHDLIINAAAITDYAGNRLGTAPITIDFSVGIFDNEYRGPAAGNWFDPFNWTAGHVPTAGEDVYVFSPFGANLNTGTGAEPAITVDTLTTAGPGTLEIGVIRPFTAAHLLNAGNVRLGNSTIDTIQNEGSIGVRNGSILTTRGDVDNSGTITLENPRFFSNYWNVTGEGTTLTGGGTVRLEVSTIVFVLARAHIQGIAVEDAYYDANGQFVRAVPTVLTNVDNHILGSGWITGEMRLINGPAGEIGTFGRNEYLSIRPYYRIPVQGSGSGVDGYLRGDVVNQGLIHAAAESTVELFGVAVDNRGGTIAADGQSSLIRLGGSDSGIEGTIVSGGLLSSGDTGGIEMRAGSVLQDTTVIAQSFFGLFGNVSVRGTVNVDGRINPFDNESLTLLGGTLNLTGRVDVYTGGQGRSIVYLAADQIFAGGGLMVMRQDHDEQSWFIVRQRTAIDANGDEVNVYLPSLHLDNRNSIQGGGLIGGLSQSIFEAESGQAVLGAVERFVIDNREGASILGTLDNGNGYLPLVLDGLGINNAGLIGSYGSRLEIINTQITQTGSGQVAVLSGETVLRSWSIANPDPDGPAVQPTSIFGGIVQVAQSGTLTTIGDIALNAVQLFNDGNITVGVYRAPNSIGGAEVTFTGPFITNNGTITVLASGDDFFNTGLGATLVLGGGGSMHLYGTGHIVLASDDPRGTAHLSSGGVTTFLYNDGNTFSGTGEIEIGLVLSNSAAGRITIEGSDHLQVNAITVDNYGLIDTGETTTADAELVFGNFVYNQGLIVDAHEGHVRFDGQLQNQAGGQIRAETGLGSFDFYGTVINDSTITAVDGGAFHFHGRAEGSGTFGLQGSGFFEFDDDFSGILDFANGDGTVQIDDLAGFSGSIRNFEAGDAVRLDGIDFGSATISGDVLVSFDGNDYRELTITDGTDTVVILFDAGNSGTFTLDAGPLTGSVLHV